MAAQINDSSLIFDVLSRKLSSLAYVKSKNDKTLLTKLLEDFNALVYNESWRIVNEKAVLVINQCCFLVSHDDAGHVKMILQLFYNLLANQDVSVEGKTLTVATVWVLDCLKTTNKEQINCSLLVLQSLVRGKCCLVSDLADRILESCKLLMVESVDDDPPQIYLNCLNVVESLAYSDGEFDIPETIALQCCDVFFNFLYSANELKNSTWHCKCLISALRGLGTLVGKDANHLSQVLPSIFGVIKGYMLYGVPGQQNYKIEKVIPANVALPEEVRISLPVKKSLGKYDRKSKKKVVTPISNITKDEEEVGKSSYVGTSEVEHVFKFDVTSDSDFSDGEAGVAGKTRLFQTKVRRCCFILLGSLLLKGDPKDLTRYLFSLLPDGSTVPHSRNLVTCLLNDPSKNCRSEILIVLSIILTKFKRFLSLADSLSKSSFTAISNNVADIIINFHTSLALSLKNENYKIITTQILKTISDLIRCSPYHKLDQGLLTKLAKEVAPLLKSKDVNVEIAALVVFGCITSIEPKVEEVKNIIFGNFDGGDLCGRPWLFQHCTKKLNDQNGCNPALAVECLQVLAALIRNFPHETVVAYPNDVENILELTSSKNDFLIRLYAAKFTETTVNALQACVTSPDESKRAPVCLAAKVWTKIIFGPVTSLLQCEDQPALRSAGYDCLANVAIMSETVETSLIFDELSRGNQIVCITHLLGCAKDEAPQVRSSGVRALSVFVEFSSLRQDPLFLLDAVDVFFKAANDENIGVRVQAAWLLGHLAEAALANISEGLDEFSESLLLRLLDAGVTLAHETKKGIPYAVRGIGNLLRMASAATMAAHKDKLKIAVESLVHNASVGSFMKARWNSCYALGTALANPVICLEARYTTFPVLFKLVESYKNFKVRISAGHALGCLPNREAYGDLYLSTWTSLLIGLENAENMADFSEYQHRDHLVDQICSTMCHLVSMVTLTDLIPLQDRLLHHIDPLNHHLSRFKNRIVPEKGGVISSADARLSELIVMDALSNDNKEALTVLCSLFFGDTPY